MPIQIADKWSIIDIHASSVPAGFKAKLDKYQSAYVDIQEDEHVYPASIKDAEEESVLRRIFDEEYKTLEEIIQICAANNALYFRIIYS